MNLAQKLLEILGEINRARKKLQSEIAKSATARAIITPNFVFARGSGWHEGVVGIVAARLAEVFKKSAFCFNENNGALKGSGRARGAINLISSVQKCAEFLGRFGGHAGAVGLNLACENFENFINALEKNIVFCESSDESSVICVNLNEINLGILEILERFEPFGNGNEMPLFCAQRVKIRASKIFGKNANHQNLVLENCKIRTVLFNDSQDYANKTADLEFSLQRDDFCGMSLKITSLANLC